MPLSPLKRVAIIGTVGIPARYGGFETLAEQLVGHLADRYELTVYCSRSAYGSRPSRIPGVRLVYLPLKANGIQSLLYDAVSIAHALGRNDVLLVLGVSGATLLPLVRRASNARTIVNIDGLEWKREKWGSVARNVLRKLEAVAVGAADEVVADNAEISRYLESEYNRPSTLIAYGGDHARHVPLEGATVDRLGLGSGSAYAFSVCRVEPENNVRLLLEAFSKPSRMPLVMVGNWKNSDYGRALLTEFAADPNLRLLPPIYDQRQLDALRSNCGLYVHGHSAGGTNPSLVEAMWLGLPVFAFDVAYNRETTSNRARYFRTAEDLEELVASVSDEARKQLGHSMKDVATARYTWKKVATEYQQLIDER